MVYDAQHALDHTEVAGWALGVLDPGDLAAFEEHLQSCAQCRVEAAEFTPVAESLALAAPAVEPPADLELKVLASVQYAVLAESAAKRTDPAVAATTPQAEVKPSATAKAYRWWHLHWTNPLVAALAVAAVTAAAFLGTALFESAPALAATFTLCPSPVKSAQPQPSPAASRAAIRSRSTLGTSPPSAPASSTNACTSAKAVAT